MALSPKENYLRIGYGKMPEYVPNWTMGGIVGGSEPEAPALMAGPMQLLMGDMPMPDPNGGETEYTDMWGVTNVTTASTGYAGLPKPNNFILDDITKWDKIIKKPTVDTSNVDWESLAKEGTAHINRETTGVISMINFGSFQNLIGFMGFTEGLVALLEEPESVKELLNFMTDFYEPIAIKTIDYYKPDLCYMLDDTASKYAPFFSVEVYRDIFKPVYSRVARHAQERGIPIQFHNCGKCEAFIPDMIDFGVRFWDPAQTENDLLAIKEKYKGQLAVCGAFDYVPDPDKGPTEDEVRAYVRSTFDKYAPGGGYAFCGGYVGTADDFEFNAKVNSWISDEVHTYGHAFYNK